MEYDILATLGSIRQELAYSGAVSGMVEFVDILNEKKDDVHEELVNARKVLNDNNIAIEKAEEVTGEDTANGRSVSLVSQPRSIGYCTDREEERNKSITEGVVGLMENENEVHKRSKKCSVFETISEHESKSNECAFDKNEFAGASVATTTTGREKYSKKVSIAENLNCDYSDSNDSYIHDIIDDNLNDCNEVIKSSLDNISKDSMRKSDYFLWTIYHMMQYPGIFMFIASSLIFYLFIF